MKRRRKVTLPDGSTGYQEIDLREKLNLSYRLYTNMPGRRYVDLLPPRHELDETLRAMGNDI